MELRTVAQLVKSPPPEPALGARLYKPTSQVVFPSPIAGYRGRFRRTEIHMIRGEKCIVRPYKVPRDPKTVVQVTRRTAMGRAKGNWHQVPAEVRAAWQIFGLDQVFPDRKISGRGAKLAGFNAWVRAQVYRQGMGRELSMEVPRFDMPTAVLEIEEVAPPDAEAFAFRLGHGMTELEGYSVLFEITPAMPTMKRKPRAQELRWAGATDAESFLPLGADGAIYVLPRARFSVEAGRRFAVRARILSPDGLPGKDLMVALVRLDAEAEAWAVSGTQAELAGAAEDANQAVSRIFVSSVCPQSVFRTTAGRAAGLARGRAAPS